MSLTLTGRTNSEMDNSIIGFDKHQKYSNELNDKESEAERRNKKSRYKNFLQFNLDRNREYLSLMKENTNAALILGFLWEHMNGYNAVMCSYSVIQESLGIHRTTASKAIRLLKERGFIYVKRSGRSNVYILNDDLVWKSWGSNAKYCEFPSNIILSMSEQEDAQT